MRNRFGSDCPACGLWHHASWPGCPYCCGWLDRNDGLRRKAMRLNKDTDPAEIDRLVAIGMEEAQKVLTAEEPDATGEDR